MVSTGKAVNCVLRFLQLSSSVVAAGLLADYASIVQRTDVGLGNYITYALSITSISILFALILFFPSSGYHYTFAFDFCLAICLIIAAGLLTSLTGSEGCNSQWYIRHWGWARGGWWRRVPAQRVVAAQVNGAGCGSWKASVGFCYIAGFWWLASFVLGLIVLYDQRMHGKHQDENSGEIGMTDKTSATDGDFSTSSKDF